MPAATPTSAAPTAATAGGPAAASSSVPTAPPARLAATAARARRGCARSPSVVLTSNRTRELHDALKRRCLYHWIGHPSLEREIEIVRLRVPDAPERLAAEAAAFVAGLRGLDLQKPPGLAETIDWARALAALGRQELDAEHVEATLGSLLKYHEDLLSVRDETLAGLVAAARGR